MSACDKDLHAMRLANENSTCIWSIAFPFCFLFFFSSVLFKPCTNLNRQDSHTTTIHPGSPTDTSVVPPASAQSGYTTALISNAQYGDDNASTRRAINEWSITHALRQLDRLSPCSTEP